MLSAGVKSEEKRYFVGMPRFLFWLYPDLNFCFLFSFLHTAVSCTVHLAFLYILAQLQRIFAISAATRPPIAFFHINAPSMSLRMDMTVLQS